MGIYIIGKYIFLNRLFSKKSVGFENELNLFKILISGETTIFG